MVVEETERLSAPSTPISSPPSPDVKTGCRDSKSPSDDKPDKDVKVLSLEEFSQIFVNGRSSGQDDSSPCPAEETAITTTHQEDNDTCENANIVAEDECCVDAECPSADVIVSVNGHSAEEAVIGGK